MRLFMLVQSDRIRGPVPKLTPLLISELRSLGCIVVTHPWGRRRELESLLSKLWRALQDVLSVRRASRGAEYDLAVVTTAHDWRAVLRDIPVALVLRRRLRPVILQFHGSRAASLVHPGRYAFKLATRVVLRSADGVLVLSTEERRQLLAFRPSTRVFVVRNPYERKKFPPRDATEFARTPELLFVGRLLREKGVLDLVEAMPSVLDRVPCRLVIVGEGEIDHAVRDRIRELGLTASVTMAGYLEGERLMRAYAVADLFVLPTGWNEGFPTVLAEAMDAGLPIITTPIRGARDYLLDRENALFVEPGDVDGLVSAIVEAIQNPDLRARMSSANRERVRLFDPREVARDYLRVLRLFAPEHNRSPGEP